MPDSKPSKQKASKAKSKAAKPVQKTARFKLHAWRLYRQTLSDYRARWWLWTRVAGIAVIISTGLRAIQPSSTGVGTDLTITLFIVTIFTLLALFALAATKLDHKPKVSEVYESSTSRFFPFLATSLVQTAVALPIIFGLIVLVLIASLGINWLLAGLSIICLVVGTLLLVRLSLAGFVAMRPGETWLTALQKSWRAVRGSTWRVAVTLLIFFLVLSLVSGLIIQLVSYISTNWLVQWLLNGLLLVLILPIFSIFGTRLLGRLEER